MKVVVAVIVSVIVLLVIVVLAALTNDYAKEALLKLFDVRCVISELLGRPC